MTLEEAKKNIQERMNILLKRYREWNDAHPEWFASGELIGQVEGLEEAMGILDEVDTEPVGNTDKLTLEELAHELRKFFDFRYITADVHGTDSVFVDLWHSEEPIYRHEYDKWLDQGLEKLGWFSFNVRWIKKRLDLSEYADENGEIDYSRCIVEVE